MFIEYLRLKNFKGIWNGMGRRDISIDLRHSTNRLVMIAGPNGSGKSVILSMLHPFPESMDNRTDLILKDTDGYKEVRIRNGKKRYKIEIHYLNKRKAKATKCFFSVRNKEKKCWDELNENGTVNSFKELVKQHLGVDESFFRLSRIGSNVTNFIDLGPAERKKFMANFLPDIEKFLYYYKVVTPKWTEMKKLIRTVADQINKLDTEEHINSRLAATSQQINALKEQMAEYQSYCDTTQGKISALDPDGTLEEAANTNAAERAKLVAKLNNAREVIAELKEATPAFKDYTTAESNERVAILKRKLPVLAANIKNDTANRDRLRKEILANSNRISECKNNKLKYKSERPIEELKDALAEFEKKAAEFKTVLDKYKEYDAMALTESQVDKTEAAMLEIIRLIDGANAAASSDTIESVLDGIVDSATCLKKIKDANKKLETVEGQIATINKSIANWKSKLPFVEVLKQRPSECETDSCSFISEALKYESAPKHIAALEKELAEKEKTRDSLVSIIDTSTEQLSCAQDLESIRKLVNERYDLLDSFYGLGEFNFKEFYYRDKDLMMNFSEARDYLFAKSKYERYSDNLIPATKGKIELLESKDEMIRKLDSDIADLLKDNAAKEEEIKELVAAISQAETKEAKAKRLVGLLEELSSALADEEIATLALKKLKKEMDASQKSIDLINKYRSQAAKSKEKAGTLKEVLAPLEEELVTLTANKARLEAHLANKAALDEDFVDLTNIRNALSPVSGIPLLFVDSQLAAIQRETNALLELAPSSKLFITGFSLNDKEFLIPVCKDTGEQAADISIASQGETALTSIALSLAIIQRSMSNYNVLLIDEMDSTLDDNNRRGFVEILDRQLDKLGVEQCFLISHNKEFDAYPLDLVLTPGHSVDTGDAEFMSNKTVLAEF